MTRLIVCSPQISTHIYCGQTAGWINMALDTEVGLGPGHILLDGDSVLPKKGAQPPPIFGQCLFLPCGWMDQDATCCEGRPQPKLHCVTQLTAKGAQSPNNFYADIYCGQIVAHLGYC